MEKTLHDVVVLYLEEGTYSAVNSRNYSRRRAIRLHAKRYTLYGRRLRQGYRMVLHEGEAFSALLFFSLTAAAYTRPQLRCCRKEGDCCQQGLDLVSRRSEELRGVYMHVYSLPGRLRSTSFFCSAAQRDMLRLDWGPLCSGYRPGRRS